MAPSRGNGKYERVTYTPLAAARAKRLRAEMTASEKKLWEQIRKLNLNIRRQAPIGPYIADFVHHASKLVIEVDGLRHKLDANQRRDAERDAWFASQGYRTIRLQDADVFGDPYSAARKIAEEIQSITLKAFPLEGGRLDGGVSAELKRETPGGAGAHSLHPRGSADTPPSQPFPPRGGRA